MTSGGSSTAGPTVFVETAARLHFGLLDLRGDLGRKFGGIGAAAPAPTLVVSARRAPTIEASGPDAERAAEFARRFLEYHGAAGSSGAQVCVRHALPSHAGLGSGTQLALAVARALAELYDFPAGAQDLARAVGRAQRSAIGTWTFAGGGLVVEGGRPVGDADWRRGAVGPLLARLPFPTSWRCVVAVPDVAPALSGPAETAAFAALPPPSEEEVGRVARLVLISLLPAVADGDLATFGDALNAIQQLNGRWFTAIQGGTFSPGASEELVRRMSECGASGVGQSSWGPAVYGIVDGEDASLRLVDRVRSALNALQVGGSVYGGPFRTAGARIWKT
jgi:beta-RFAP synthase